MKARVLGRTAFVFVVSAQHPLFFFFPPPPPPPGKTLTWPDGGRVRPILRPPLDSDTTFLRKMSPAMDQAVTEAHARPGMRVAATDGEAADAVEGVPGAVGTSTLALIAAERRPLKALAINGVRPTAESVGNGSYPYVKTLYLVCRTPRPVSSDSWTFSVGEGAGRPVESGVRGPVTRGPRPAAPSDSRRRRTLTALASILAVVVAAVVPAGHLVASLPYEAGILEATVAGIAARLSELAIGGPNSWQFQTHRLEALLDPPPHHARARRFTIEDPNGRAGHGDDLQGHRRAARRQHRGR